MSLDTDKKANQVYCQMFRSLNEAAVRALHRDKSHANARHLQELGTCHDLFRSVLRRIANDDVWTSMPSAGWNQEDTAEVPSSGFAQGPEFKGHVTSNTMCDLIDIRSFIIDFLHCLSPLPNDDDTTRLLNDAYKKLLDVFLICVRVDMAIMIQDIEYCRASLRCMQQFFPYVTDLWPRLQQQSDAERWNRLVQLYQLDNPDKLAEKAARKEVVRSVQHTLPQNLVGAKVEMCANCFVLETDLPLETTLSKCSKCRRVKYCGRDCQVEHWKNEQKTQSQH